MVKWIVYGACRLVYVCPISIMSEVQKNVFYANESIMRNDKGPEKIAKVDINLEDKRR